MDNADQGHSKEPDHWRSGRVTRTTTSGALLALASLPFGIVHAGRSHLPTHDLPSWLARGMRLTGAQATTSSQFLWWAGAALASLFFIAGALAVPRSHRFGPLWGSLAMGACLALAIPTLSHSPLGTLASLVTYTLALIAIWKVGAPLLSINQLRRRPLYEGQAHGAAMSTLFLWLLWPLYIEHPTTTDALVVAWAALINALLNFEWSARTARLNPYRAAGLLLTLAVCLALSLLHWGSWWDMASFSLTPSLFGALFIRVRKSGREEQGHWSGIFLDHPARLFVGTFAGLSAIGTILLSLPQSSANGQSHSLVDSAFTASSAVCVTGLAVLNTPVDFSGLGQFFILLLIQIGGLGIMTFSTAVVWALGRRLSLRHEGAVASLISPQDRGQLFTSAVQILKLTLLAEGGGAILLTLAFMGEGDSIGTATWRGVFTAISAFCNAGFALQGDSLVPYQSSPLILHIIALLIILGGLSPLAVFSLPRIIRRSPHPVSAQARLGLSTTLALFLLGFFLYLALEWDASLAELTWADRLHNAWFQSVTLRTAGFNSVDLTVVRSATLTLMLFMMFVGGSPGGTAGGVKTTTVALLCLSTVRAIRGHWDLQVFGKTIPDRTRTKAAVVVAIAVASGMVALLALQLTQNMEDDMALFEVISALGTVGLTIGGTGQLDGIGKAIIILCMFVGRVGGLTLLMFLSSRRPLGQVARPIEEIDVG